MNALEPKQQQQRQKTIIIILVKFYSILLSIFCLSIFLRACACVRVCVSVCEMFAFSFRRHSIKQNLCAQRQNAIIVIVVVVGILARSLAPSRPCAIASIFSDCFDVITVIVFGVVEFRSVFISIHSMAFRSGVQLSVKSRCCVTAHTLSHINNAKAIHKFFSFLFDFYCMRLCLIAVR